MRSPSGRTVALALLVLTVGQLAVATFVPGLAQFEGKAFGARLVAYPVMMLTLPAIWAVLRRHPLPWDAFAWIMAPFLVDVTGNTLDLYDTVAWWDDLNHFVNWFFLAYGGGLLIARSGAVGARWALALTVTGLGAVLAIGWELGEWYTFIRHGTELDTAYEDTLFDEVLGTLGSLVAGLVLARRHDQRGGDAGHPLTPAGEA